MLSRERELAFPKEGTTCDETEAGVFRSRDCQSYAILGNPSTFTCPDRWF